MRDEDEQPAEYYELDYLRDAEWRWEQYRRPTSSWDHEHCLICFRRIAETDYGDPEALQWAYTHRYSQEPDGSGGYEWLCPDCFAQFREVMRWRAIGGPGSGVL